MNSKKRLVILMVAAVVASGSGLRWLSADGEDEVAYAAALDEMAARRYEVAAQRYTDLLASHPGSTRVADALLGRMRAWQNAGEHSEVATEMARLESSGELGERIAQARFIVARSLEALGRDPDAAQVWRGEVHRLNALAHRQEIAAHYLAIADRALDPPERLGARPDPDHQLALTHLLAARKVMGERDPDDLDRRIALSLEALGRNREALVEWDRLARSESLPLSAAGLHHGALLRLTIAGKSGEARRLLAQLREERYLDTPEAPLALEAMERTYGPVASRSAETFELSLAPLHEFVRLYPSHERAAAVARRIGDLCLERGDTVAAIAAWEAYLSRYADDEHAPAKLLARARAHAGLHRYDLARKDLSSLLSRYPQSPQWQTAQEALVVSAIAEGSHLIESGAVEAGMKVLEGFLVAAPLHVRAFEIEMRLVKLERDRGGLKPAVERLERIASRRPGTNEGATALLEAGDIRRDQLVDLDAAIATYRRVLAEFGGTTSSQAAAARIAEMEEEELSVLVPRVVTTAEGGALVHITSRNVGELEGRATALDLAAYLDRKRAIERIEGVMVDIVAPDHTWKRPTPGYRDYRRFEEDARLPLTDPGAYIVTLRGGDLVSRVLSVVSDLSMITKQTDRSVLAFVKNEVTGRPAPGVAITVTDGAQILAEGVTGPDGVWKCDLESSHPAVSIFAAGDGGHFAFNSSAAQSVARWGATGRIYLYTDRPIYRPGQQVSWRGILRDVEGGAYVTPQGTPVIVEVRDSRGAMLNRQRVVTSELGTCHGAFELPEEPAFGDATLTVSALDRSASTTFVIDAYRKPELLVDVVPTRAASLAGEEIEVEARVLHSFGAPAVSLPVRWAVFTRPYVFDDTRHREHSWFFRAQSTPASHRESGDWLLEGEGVTDEEGKLEIRFTPDDPTRDQMVDVYVEATAPSRRVATGAASVPVTMRGLFAVLTADRQVYHPGDEARVHVITVDGAHRPLAAASEVELLKRRREPGRIVTQPVGSQSLSTDDSGEGWVSFALAEPGEYLVRFSGRDRAGAEVRAETTLQVAGRDPEEEGLRVLAEREVYRRGETARVLVNVPRVPVTALLTYEAESVLEVRVIELTETSSTIDAPLGENASPNVFIAVALTHEHRLLAAVDEVLVFQFLEVEIDLPDSAMPGEEVVVDLTATDHQGRPVLAELSLAVVDETVLALAPDKSGDIRTAFFGSKRAHAVSTASSVTFEYEGKTERVAEELQREKERRKQVAMRRARTGEPAPDSEILEANDSEPLSKPGARRPMLDAPMEKDARLASKGEMDAIGMGGGAGGNFGGRFGGRRSLTARGGGGRMAAPEESPPEITRRRFADTAFWSATVRTGADGKARVKMKLPDDLTTWRLDARGVDAGVLVGAGHARLRAEMPLMVRLDAPRFMVEGDRTTLRAVAHSYLPEKRQAEVAIETVELELEGESDSKFQLAPGEARAVDFRTIAPAAAMGVARASVKAGDAADAEERSFAVIPRGEYVRRGSSGILTGVETIQIHRPVDALPGTESLELILTTAVEDELLPAIQYLRRFPYGCTEQTVNRFLPMLTLRRHLRLIGERDEMAGLQAEVERGIVRLTCLQRGDGGWGWWRDGEADAAMTALALEGLLVASDQGFEVDATVITRGIAAASEIAQGAGDEEASMIVRALAGISNERGYPAEAHVRLMRRRESISSAALAMLATAADRRGAAGAASDCLRLVEARLVVGPGGEHLEGGATDGRSASAVEATARGLEAILAIDPESAHVPRMASWLRAQTGGRRRLPTRAQAARVQALAVWAARRAAGATDCRIEVKGPTGVLATRELKGVASARLEVPLAGLPTGDVSLSVSLQGRGELRHALEHTWLAPLEQATADRGEGDAPVETSGGRFELRRRVVDYVPAHERAALTGGRKAAGWDCVRERARPLARELPTLERLSAQQRGLVVLDLLVRERVDYVILEDPIAAGVDVGDLVRDSTSNAVRSESRDRGVAFFFSRLEPGRHRIVYPIRAIAPGEYTILPARMEAMYAPELTATTAAGRLVIEADAAAERQLEPTPDELLAQVRQLRAARDLAGADALADRLLDGHELRDEIREELLGLRLEQALASGDDERAFSTHQRLRGRARLGLEQTVALGDAALSIGRSRAAIGAFQDATRRLFQREFEVSNAKEKLGWTHAAVEMRERLTGLFPDESYVASTLYEAAGAYRSVTIEEIRADGVKKQVKAEAACRRALREFLGRHPENPLADDAAYALVQAHLRIHDDAGANRRAASFLERYPESEFLDDAQYAVAFTYFAAGELDDAAAAAHVILGRKFPDEHGVPRSSPYVTAAEHLLAQVAHIQGDLKAAVRHYRAVAGELPDAALALAHLEEPGLTLPETVPLSVDEAAAGARIPLRLKNAGKVTIAVYKIDLMLFFALRQDLSGVKDIDLTGIAPRTILELETPEATDFRWHERELELPVEEPGAYLVVARAGDLFASSVVLTSELAIEVQRSQGRIRVYATSSSSGGPAAGVYVKVSAAGALIGDGNTDARGVLELFDPGGRIAVLADRDGHPALHRD